MPRPPGRRSVAWAVSISILVSAGILAWVHLRGGGLRDAASGLDPRVLPLALALHVTAHMLWGTRIALLADGTPVRLTAPGAWRLVTAGVFGGAVTPARLGGEAVKMTVLVRRGAPPAQAARLLLADRSLDLLFFILLGLLALAVLPPVFGADAHTATVLAGIGSAFLAVFLMLLGLVLMMPRRVARVGQRMTAWAARLVHRPVPSVEAFLDRFVTDTRAGVVAVYRNRPARLMGAWLLTAANWIVEFGVLWALLKGFGHDVPYATVFFVGIVLTLVSNLPVTPGGAGVAEAASLALLTPLAPGLTPLFAVVWRSLTYLYDLVVGAVVVAVTLPASRKDLKRRTT